MKQKSKKLIRRSQLNINYANSKKLNQLDTIMNESKRVINCYIDIIWNQKDFNSKFISFKIDDTWLSSRLQQCLGKQALEIVKSQRKRKKKTKPIFKKDVINLDSRFVDFQFDNNSFDIWIRISSIGNRIKLKLPSKRHKHYNRFKDSDWNLKKSIRLKRNYHTGKYYIEVYFEKEKEKLKETGKDIGLDCGYKKLLISSENKIYDKDMESIYEKTSRKTQGSKAFKRSLIERDNRINESINEIDFDSIKTIVVENLKDVKKNSKGKIYKKFNNKLQRWSYTKVLSRLEMICDEKGIDFIKVNPRYTSQTCNRCGVIDKDSRNGESFQCTACGYEADADYNASCNILQLGVYSP